jgi:hypothetical protein
VASRSSPLIDSLRCSVRVKRMPICGTARKLLPEMGVLNGMTPSQALSPFKCPSRLRSV